MLKVLSWNMKHDPNLWAHVLASGADIALLQEACAPPADLDAAIDAGAEPWETAGRERRPWRTAVVALTTHVRLERLSTGPLCSVSDGGLGVSRPGTIAAAGVVDPDTGQASTLISMYAPWERPHTSTDSGWIYADASAHRLISDISMLVGRQSGHRILAAGDLNCLHGHGEDGSPYWANRYRTVFDRMSAIGLEFAGPQHPDGRQANPWPSELPKESLNVPTFHSSSQHPGTATRQLDFVFASPTLKPSMRVRAMNDPAQWGPSDHCQVRILLDDMGIAHGAW